MFTFRFNGSFSGLQVLNVTDDFGKSVKISQIFLIQKDFMLFEESAIF
jgi:hypothetical protein